MAPATPGIAPLFKAGRRGKRGRATGGEESASSVPSIRKAEAFPEPPKMSAYIPLPRTMFPVHPSPTERETRRVSTKLSQALRWKGPGDNKVKDDDQQCLPQFLYLLLTLLTVQMLISFLYYKEEN